MLSKIRTFLRRRLTRLRLHAYRKIWKMDIGENCGISMAARLDKTYPKGIHIGRDSGVAFGAAILTHDFINRVHKDTWIGERCHIGAYAVIFPGVRVGNGCIVSAGSVVMQDVPDNCLVFGNPARILERNLRLGPLGIREKTFVDTWEKTGVKI